MSQRGADPTMRLSPMPSLRTKSNRSSSTWPRPRVGWYWLLIFLPAILLYALVLPLYALCRTVERIWPVRLIQPPDLVPEKGGSAPARATREIRSFL